MELTSKGDGSAWVTYSVEEQRVLANAAERLRKARETWADWADDGNEPDVSSDAWRTAHALSPDDLSNRPADDLPSEPVGDTGQALNEHRPVQRSQPLTA